MWTGWEKCEGFGCSAACKQNTPVQTVPLLRLLTLVALLRRCVAPVVLSGSLNKSAAETRSHVWRQTPYTSPGPVLTQRYSVYFSPWPKVFVVIGNNRTTMSKWDALGDGMLRSPGSLLLIMLQASCLTYLRYKIRIIMQECSNLFLKGSFNMRSIFLCNCTFCLTCYLACFVIWSHPPPLFD